MAKREIHDEIFNVLNKSPSFDDPLGVVAFPFEGVPTMVKNRRGILVNGWLITAWLKRITRDPVSAAAKKAYQQKLREKIKRISQKKKEEQEDIYPLVQEITSYWDSKQERHFQYTGEKETLEGKKVYQRVGLFPLCMSILHKKIIKEGYLSHEGRLQLGFFLKGLDMPVKEQLRFWYEYSVDDAGMSWEEFKRGPGYQVRHLYGLEGSGIDYNVPKCETIINGYFCPYANLSQVELRNELTARLSTDSKVTKIIELARNGRFQRACAHYLEEAIGAKKVGTIYHPMQFVRKAFKTTNEEEAEGEDDAREKSKDD